MRIGFSTKVGKRSRVYIAPGGGRKASKTKTARSNSKAGTGTGILGIGIIIAAIWLWKRAPWAVILLILAAIALPIALYIVRRCRQKAAEAQKAAELAAAEEERAERQREADRNSADRIAAIKKERAERIAAYEADLAAIPAAEIRVTDEPAPKLELGDLSDICTTNVTKRSNLFALGNFVAVDVETTGLRAGLDEIVEVAAVRFRGWEPVEQFSTLCGTKKPIPPEASNVNHITDDMIAGLPLFGRIADSLSDFISTDNIVAHNIEFDLRFLHKNGVNFSAESRRYYDTLELSQVIAPKASNHTLDGMCFYYGILRGDSHRALSDAYAVGLLLRKLADDRRDDE